MIPPTRRLYWEDDHCFESGATLVAARQDAWAFDQTCFYPGGGGQPPDRGTITLPDGQQIEVVSAETGPDHAIWHRLADAAPAGVPGIPVRLALDRQRRLALTRYHTVLHVLNTLALREYNAWITGVQIGVDYSRIDFKWEGFSPALCQGLEQRVNSVLQENRALKSYYLPEEDFRERKDLLRTLEAQPPVIDGRVRVVEIEGFDAQACGGTHAGSTAEVGAFSITRTENKGKINKRLYIRLAPGGPE